MQTFVSHHGTNGKGSIGIIMIQCFCYVYNVSDVVVDGINGYVCSRATTYAIDSSVEALYFADALVRPTQARHRLVCRFRCLSSSELGSAPSIPPKTPLAPWCRVLSLSPLLPPRRRPVLCLAEKLLIPVVPPKTDS